MDAGDPRFDRAVEAFARQVRHGAARDDAAWARQREAIAQRLQRRPGAFPALAWVAVAASAAAIVAGVLVAGGPGAHGPQAPGVQASDPDDELIAEVERAMSREMPSAFEPADEVF